MMITETTRTGDLMPVFRSGVPVGVISMIICLGAASLPPVDH
jgi:hypothetical protein